MILDPIFSTYKLHHFLTTQVCLKFFYFTFSFASFYIIGMDIFMIALLFTLLHLALILTLFEPFEKEFCREGKEIRAISLVPQLASPGCRTHTTYTCIVSSTAIPAKLCISCFALHEALLSVTV